MSDGVPDQDLRERYKEPYGLDYPKDRIKPDHDPRFIESVGGQLVPWTFVEVPLSQKIRCKVGLHRGRAETLGGGVCFYCSYCGHHTEPE